MSQHITVAAYDPLWVKKYEEEVLKRLTVLQKPFLKQAMNISANLGQRADAICVKEEMKEPIRFISFR